jgi:hypothetical protein
MIPWENGIEADNNFITTPLTMTREIFWLWECLGKDLKISKPHFHPG